MTIDILDGAEKDLVEGFEFYERQLVGLGDYFLDSIFSDIESLQLYAGIHAVHFGYCRLLAKRFPFAIIIESGPRWFKSMQYSIADVIRLGFVVDSHDVQKKSLYIVCVIFVHSLVGWVEERNPTLIYLLSFRNRKIARCS